MSSEPFCPTHPDGRVRRYRTIGAGGPGVYPQCVPADGSAPHLLDWERHRAPVTTAETGPFEIVLDERAGATSGLSRSELSVLCAAANGLTSLETGRLLGKGAETVKTQRHQILLKLGARNITQAVCIATRNGHLHAERAHGLLAS
ncbi:MAG TPA: helix-turn-helix domain-containing protein [Gaiellales bacterium]|jgi:DNA-binding CsgD family transcriptional regulator